MLGDLEWRLEAACAKTNHTPEELDLLFFPDSGTSQKEAKEICDSCTVQRECLEYALRMNIAHGIWGGTSERQRRRMRKERGWIPAEEA